MIQERCPVCRTILPPAKTCEECGETFYRSENGRTGGSFCSLKCAGKNRTRRWRKRHP